MNNSRLSSEGQYTVPQITSCISSSFFFFFFLSAKRDSKKMLLSYNTLVSFQFLSHLKCWILDYFFYILLRAWFLLYVVIKAVCSNFFYLGRYDKKMKETTFNLKRLNSTQKWNSGIHKDNKKTFPKVVYILRVVSKKALKLEVCDDIIVLRLNFLSR